ncbi:hypothetical protein [Prevotella sp. AGR2160]|uniref:hypothetical protein n=1 Tax=Prevotella sp. AGR2160 TaxID=1280674 RepID=UPI0003F7E078|nr:hypothetical protein [Prevotella sp. AGR2160]
MEEKSITPHSPRHAIDSSMKRRGSSRDYRQRGWYMITLVVKGRRPLLGNVIGDPAVQYGEPEYPRLSPSPLGEAVQEQILGLPSFYPQVSIEGFQLMPDHLHLLLSVKEEMPKPLGLVIRGFVQGCNKAYRRLVEPLAGTEGGASASASPSGGSAASFHGLPLRACALQAQGASLAPQRRPEGQRLRYEGGLLFEHGFNDRILTHRGQLRIWRHYLADNPRRLLMKRCHPDLFRIQRNLEAAGMTFSAIGNRFLLDRPLFQVQCSRSLTAEQIEAQKRKALAACAEGVVLISPAISPGERAIMRAAFEAGAAEIVLLENGFTDLAKPGGARFDACSRGQLLLLAPWEHHNDRRVIQRGQCLQLNEMARRLCER